MWFICRRVYQANWMGWGPKCFFSFYYYFQMKSDLGRTLQHKVIASLMHNITLCDISDQSICVLGSFMSLSKRGVELVFAGQHTASSLHCLDRRNKAKKWTQCYTIFLFVCLSSLRCALFVCFREHICKVTRLMIGSVILMCFTLLVMWI